VACTILYSLIANERWGKLEMSGVTKAKINIKEGIIELEGSEDFVIKQLEVFGKEINVKKPLANHKEETPKKENAEELDKKIKRKGIKATQTINPIPLNLKGKDDEPPLRDFYMQKNPSSQWESLVIFAYYLKEYLGINQMEAGHVAFCCNEVGIKIPKNIAQMFYDIYHIKGWLNLVDGRKYVEINTAGENLIKYDLPRKDNATTN
jgi:hypothetical protein